LGAKPVANSHEKDKLRLLSCIRYKMNFAESSLTTKGHRRRSVQLSPAQIAALATRPVIVISPHFDDACFSIGCLLEEIHQGLLINVFTRSVHAPREAPCRDETRVHAIREAEDAAFAERCGLTRIELSLEEPPLRGRRPTDSSGVAEDTKRAAGPLLRVLERSCATDGGKCRLFVPMGIGRHANHRAVSNIIETNLETLTPSYDVLFYEDLPYAHHPLHRRLALTRAQRLKRRLHTRYVLPVSWRRKKALIALYPSQFKRMPSRYRFRPAALSPMALHEAFWAVDGVGI
jgi:hypothetical protein